MHDLGQCEVKHGVRLELVNLYNSEAGNPQLPEKIRRTRRKRVANSALVLSGAGSLGLLVLGTSWFVTAHFQKPNDDQLMSVAATTPAATPVAATTSTPDVTLANMTLGNSIWRQPLKTALHHAHKNCLQAHGGELFTVSGRKAHGIRRSS